MGSILLSRVLGVAREMVLAHQVGAGPEMDAYVAAFTIPEVVNHLLAGGFLSITFIPIFQGHINRGDPARAWRVFSNLLTVGSLLMIGFIALTMLLAEPLLGLMGSNINAPGQLELTARMTRIILPAQLFIYCGALLMAVQFATKRFFIPALTPLCYNVGIIAGGVLLSARLGIEAFSWGVVAGAFSGSVLFQVPGALRAGMRYRPRVDLRDPDLKRYVLLTLPLMVGLSMQFSSELFFRYFGSFLGAGGLASLNYSLRTMWSLVGLFGQALGVASYPFLADLAVKKEFGQMNQLARGVISRAIILIIPFSGVMAVVAPQIITVLFQRGQFDAAATAATAPVLGLYLVGAFAIASTTLVSRCFYALQNTWLPMVLSTLAALGSVPIYITLSQTMGARGIALASSIFAITQFLVLYGIWIENTRRGVRCCSC